MRVPAPEPAYAEPSTQHLRAQALFRRTDFRRFWAASTVSTLGTAVTSLALPLTAVTLSQATPAQMGLLVALQNAPAFLLGLPAGVWADRAARRGIMIRADLARAAALTLIPILAWLHCLDLTALNLIALVVGACAVLFDVALPTLVPSLLPQDEFIDGNAKLSMSTSAMQVAGPALAGFLIQWLSAPFAIVLDAASYLCGSS